MIDQHTAKQHTANAEMLKEVLHKMFARKQEDDEKAHERQKELLKMQLDMPMMMMMK